MVQGNRLTPSGAVAASTRRLAAGLALSTAVHVLTALGVSPRAGVALASPYALQVDIERADATSAAAPLPLPATEQPQQPRSAPAARGEPPPQFALPLDRYFSAREVEVRAISSNEVELVYPEPAYERRIEGKLTLRIFINEHGGVDRVTVLDATPPGVFEEATLAAARVLQFTPALIGGRAVKSSKTIEVVFDPRTVANANAN